ncbi:MAG: hypothetical protein JWO38_7760 [Gemmataceae bacterium]|nr:hypothetical protein [Gemmataceae bacterium]
MRGTKWVVGVAVILAGSVDLTRAKDDDAAYDLRGPAPEKGQVTVSKTTFKIKNADVAIKAGGTTIDAKQTLTAVEEDEVKVLAVSDRQVTKAQTKVVKEQIETVTSLGGNDMTDKKPGDLEGEVIISERTGPGKWKHTLVDNKPTEKQKKELDKRVGPENEDDLYPEGKVKVGHTWTVDATALQRMFGGSITDLKGKLKMKFVKVEDVDGELCAVIESVGVIKGIAKEDEGELNVELDMKGTTWRAIKSGQDVKDKATGKIKMDGKIEMDGVKAEIALEGPFTINSTSKFKTAKSE